MPDLVDILFSGMNNSAAPEDLEFGQELAWM
jgi:hypothetical protein